MSDTQARDGRHDFRNMPDLASRRVGGSVVGASDELFAERENLIKPEPPSYSAHTFGHKGQIYDGWETRRRREPGDGGRQRQQRQRRQQKVHQFTCGLDATEAPADDDKACQPASQVRVRLHLSLLQARDDPVTQK
jgi:hypothetical protein